jgi:alpha-beta hydrolase superfamily lysophospholipase
MMQRHEGTFSGAGGLSLYYQSWHPSEPGRGIIVVVHGLGGHCGSFSHIVNHFLPLGYIIYGFDLRGHGRSPGQRGYLNHWTEFREDLSRFLYLIQTQESALPCFLLGHSLGALIALDYSLRDPSHNLSQIKGVVALSPALKQVGVSPIRVILGQVMSWVYPRFSLNTGIDPTTASRDAVVLDAYDRDPLRHGKGTARLATEFLATTAWVGQHASELQVPLLMMHGAADRVTSSIASYRFFQQITFTDKQWCDYADSYHHLYDDLNYPDVLSDIENWLEHHLESNQARLPMMHSV